MSAASAKAGKPSNPRKPHKYHAPRKSSQDPQGVPTKSDQHRHAPRQRPSTSTCTGGASCINPDQRSHDKTKDCHHSQSSSDSTVIVKVVNIYNNDKKPRRYDSSKGPGKKAAEPKVVNSVTTAPIPPRSVPRPKPKHPSTVHTPRDPPGKGRAQHPPSRSVTSKPSLPPKRSTPPRRPPQSRKPPPMVVQINFNS